MENKKRIDFYWDKENGFIAIEKDYPEDMYVFQLKDGSNVCFIMVLHASQKSALLIAPFAGNFELYLVPKSALKNKINFNNQLTFVFNKELFLFSTKPAPKEQIIIKSYLLTIIAENGQLGLKNCLNKVPQEISPTQYLTILSQALDEKFQATAICHTLYKKKITHKQNKQIISPAFTNKKESEIKPIKVLFKIKQEKISFSKVQSTLKKVIANKNWSTQNIVELYINLGKDRFQATKILKTMLLFRRAFQKDRNQRLFFNIKLEAKDLYKSNEGWSIKCIFNQDNRVGYAGHQDYIGLYSTSYEFQVFIENKQLVLKNMAAALFLGDRLIFNQKTSQQEVIDLINKNKKSFEKIGIVFNYLQNGFFSEKTNLSKIPALKSKLTHLLPTTLMVYQDFCDDSSKPVIKNILDQINLNPSNKFKDYKNHAKLLNMLFYNLAYQKQLFNLNKNNINKDSNNFVQLAIKILLTKNNPQQLMKNNTWLNIVDAELNACLYFWLDAGLNIVACINNNILAPEISFFSVQEKQDIIALDKLCNVSHDAIDSIVADNPLYIKLKGFGYSQNTFSHAIELAIIWDKVEASLLTELKYLHRIYCRLISVKIPDSLELGLKYELSHYNNTKTFDILKLALLDQENNMAPELKPFFEEIEQLTSRISLCYAKTRLEELNQTDSAFDTIYQSIYYLIEDGFEQPNPNRNEKIHYHITKQKLRGIQGLAGILDRWSWTAADKRMIDENMEKIISLLNNLETTQVNITLQEKAKDIITEAQGVAKTLAIIIQERILHQKLQYFKAEEKMNPSPHLTLLIDEFDEAIQAQDGIEVDRLFVLLEEEIVKLNPSNPSGI